MFNGKIHYKWPCQIAMLVHQYHGFSQLRSSYEESLELLNAYLEHRLKEEVAWQNFLVHKDEQMGMSENSVPLHPMVNDHYPY